MRTSAFLSAVLLSAAPALAQRCNPDNCARAVTGGVSSAQHVAECSTNLRCTTTLSTVTTTSTSLSIPALVTISTTVMPAALSTTTTVSGSTITSSTTTTLGTATITSTVTPSPVVITTTAFTTFARRSVGLERRQQACSAFTLPGYAAACQGFARYSSACSCAGVTATTVTVSSGTTTVTSTSTAAALTTTVSVIMGQSTSTVTTTLAASTTTLTISASSATTTTTTSLSASTTTTTSTIASATAPSCNNQGLQFAYYEDNQPAGLANDNQRFDPTVVKNRAPVFTGVTTTLGFILTGAPPPASPVYGTSPANGTAPRQFNYIVNHRGYIFTQVGGTYTFRVSQVDDIVDTWVGGAAFSGWSNFNAASRVFFTGADGTFQRTSSTFSFFLNAGQYVPFRVIFKQNGGDASFAYSVVAPNGQEIIGQSSAGNQGIVQYGCDVANAAMYPPFGAET